MKIIKKSIIPWVGGKAKLMWIINLLAPLKYGRSVDVFGGSATVTLNLECPTNRFRIYNDYNANLVNLMRCARDRPLHLITELGFLPLNSRDDFELCKRFIAQEKFTDEDLKAEMELAETLFEPPQAEELKAIMQKSAEDKDIKRAAAYYKMLRYSFNSNGVTYGGKKCNICRFFVDIWKFSKYFKDVTIENKDFEELIKQYDSEDAFIYCDPPYYMAEGFYAVVFTKDDHRRLHDSFDEIDGKVMVSYNNADYIKELYRDFYIFLTTRDDGMSRTKGKKYEELIMTNYDPRAHIAERGGQLNMFSGLLGAMQDGEYELIHEPTIIMKDEVNENEKPDNPSGEPEPCEPDQESHSPCLPPDHCCDGGEDDGTGCD